MIELFHDDVRHSYFSPQSGMAPLIRAVLSKLIGDEQAQEIEIIANDVDIRENGTWEIKYRHPSRQA